MDNSSKTRGKDKEAPKAEGSLETGLATRGKFFEGTVVSDKMHGSVVVEWARVVKSGKFNRFNRLSSRVKARNPANVSAKEGDYVRIEETRKISKTINFIVTKVIRKKGEAA